MRSTLGAHTRDLVRRSTRKEDFYQGERTGRVRTEGEGGREEDSFSCKSLLFITRMGTSGWLIFLMINDTLIGAEVTGRSSLLDPHFSAMLVNILCAFRDRDRMDGRVLPRISAAFTSR